VDVFANAVLHRGQRLQALHDVHVGQAEQRAHLGLRGASGDVPGSWGARLTRPETSTARSFGRRDGDVGVGDQINGGGVVPRAAAHRRRIAR
jgi:hypothetical protein